MAPVPPTLTPTLPPPPPGPAWWWGHLVPTPPSPTWLSPAPSSSAPGPPARPPATPSPWTLRVRGCRGGAGWARGGGGVTSPASSPSPTPPGDETETQNDLKLHTYKSHQWMGASVTSWDGKLVVGAPGGQVGGWVTWVVGTHLVPVPRPAPRCSTGTPWKGHTRLSAPRRASASWGLRGCDASPGTRPAATSSWPAPTARAATVRAGGGWWVPPTPRGADPLPCARSL